MSMNSITETESAKILVTVELEGRVLTYWSQNKTQRQSHL
jgi:hypothetical protein